MSEIPKKEGKNLSQVKYEEMEGLVNYINNNKDFTWKAQMNDKFKGLSLAELKNENKI
jgi:hypothetical protein